MKIHEAFPKLTTYGSVGAWRQGEKMSKSLSEVERFDVFNID